MSKKQKLIEKFSSNPTSIKLAQMIVVLEHFGFHMIPAKGSHMKFKHPQLSEDLIIPIHNNECKDFYKIQAKKCIEKLV